MCLPRLGGWYPRWDSNPRLWLRRPVLYPLSYGGASKNYSRRPHTGQADSRGLVLVLSRPPKGRRFTRIATPRQKGCRIPPTAPQSPNWGQNLIRKGLDFPNARCI